MNNNFYYNNNNKEEHPSNQKDLLLIFASIVLIAIGYIMMTSGMFDKVSKVETTIDNKIVYQGKDELVKVKIKTNNEFNPVVKFRSKNGKFTVSEDRQEGKEVETKIIAKESGEDILIVEVGRDEGKKDKVEEVKVLICEGPKLLNTTDKTLSMKEGNNLQLKFNVDNKCLGGYEIYVENDKIADIDNNYVLNAKKSGKTTLVLKGSKTIKYTLNVKPLKVNVTGVKINTKNFNLAIGKTKNLSVSVKPSDATNKKVTYQSSDTNIATVSSSGKVKGINTGVAIITVTTEENSKTDTVKVKVYKPTPKPVEPPKPVSVKSIKFEKSSYTASLNQTIVAVVGITPSNATNKTVTCKSLNTTIATVTYSGNKCTIKGLKTGTATIEAYSADGNKKTTTTVTVKPISTKSISFEKSSYSMNVGDSKTLNVKFNPTNASNQVITCSSSNNSIATVSAKNTTCVVKGVKAGSVTITATSQDGAKTAKTTVKVNNVSVTGVSFAATSYSVDAGSTKALAVTISPSNATNKGYTCTSSNQSIATITSGCTVKGVKAGSATITVTTSDGSKTATTSVTVKNVIKKETIRVASFNVGYFACGSYSGAHCSPSGTSIGTLLKNQKVDIAGLQEARDTVPATSGWCYYGTGNAWAAKEVLGYHMNISCPVNINVILSKYAFQGEPEMNRMTCGEMRALTRAVLKINGVNISFYNTHLGLKSCNEEHFKKVAEIVKNDPNPVIMTGDWNYTKLDRFKQYLLDPSDMQFKIAAYDTTTHNMWNKTSYCDAVLVKSKGHIDIVSSKTVDAFQSYSDHNLVIATLNIY